MKHMKVTSFLVLLALVLSCKERKRATLFEFDGNTLNTDSLMQVVKNTSNEYVVYYRHITPDFNDNMYILLNDSVASLYKFSRHGVYLYTAPYWRSESLRWLNVNANILLVCNDSIYKDSAIKDHSPWFNIEIKQNQIICKKNDFYYKIKKEQVLASFISMLDRDILNAEQDIFYWVKIE